MFGARSRGLLLLAAVSLSMLTAANSAAVGPAERYREAVDERSYPWSSIGKLLNGTGGNCSGVVIARDKVLTAAHCLFNYRTRRFIPAAALHFLVAYRGGRYSAHVRIASYEIGAGFNPLFYDQTSGADWAVLTVTESLPSAIEPLQVQRDVSPGRTKAVLAGYAQERAFAMTADRNCELGDKTENGRFLMHTCRSTKGYSGAPILVNVGGSEMQVAGIQIASLRSDGVETMIAVPARAIWRQQRDDRRALPAYCGAAGSGVEDRTALDSIHARMAFSPPETDDVDIVSSISQVSDAQASEPALPDAVGWAVFDPADIIAVP